MTDHLQRVDAQVERADEHYEKLCKLEEAMRKRLRVLRDLPILPDDRDWKIPEEIYETLRSLLSDAGLE